MVEKKRARFLDIAKGVGILAIVLLHIEEGVLPGPVNVFIGSFMISLFFVTTGWLDAQRTEPLPLKELIRKRWKQLAVPYLWWSGLILLFDGMLWLFGYYDTYFISREVYKTFVLRGIGTLWFLPALFGGEIIWIWIRRKQSLRLCLLALALTLVAQYFYGAVFNGATSNVMKIIQAPFYTINNILMAWIGIGGGFVFRKVFDMLHGATWSKGMLLLSGTVCCILAYGAANHWPLPVAWGLGAPLLGPFGILLLALALENSRCTDYLNYWGRNSMALMVTHYSFVMVACDIFHKWMFQEPKIVGYPAFAYFAVMMILEYFIAEYITKKHPHLVGK